MIHRLWGYALVFLALSAHAHIASDSIQTQVWDKTPIVLDLPIGRERLLHFDAPVSLALDKRALPDDQLRVINANQTLYLQAQVPFPLTRLMVKLSNGDLLQLDVIATEDAQTHPIRIVPANHQAHRERQDSPSEPVATVQLARFAVQQLYAPKRLLNQPRDIKRVPLNAPNTLPLYGNGQVMAMPLVSYASPDGYITALLLRNLNAEHLALDYASLKGQWTHAFYYPQTTLGPAGQRDDSTTVFLLSKQPFHLAYEAVP